MKYIFNKIIWYFKQLFPLIYYSEYIEKEKREVVKNKYIEIDIRKVSTWKMWFGKCYNVKVYEIK